MALTEEQVLEKIQQIIADQTGNHQEDITMDSDLVKIDEVIDSTALIEEFGIEIPKPDYGDFQTVRDLVNYIVEHSKQS